jgi:hypothetical protein
MGTMVPASSFNGVSLHSDSAMMSASRAIKCATSRGARSGNRGMSVGTLPTLRQTHLNDDGDDMGKG